MAELGIRLDDTQSEGGKQASKFAPERDIGLVNVLSASVAELYRKFSDTPVINDLREALLT